jgi:hypothetical protein
VVVGQAAAPESEPSAVAARTGISSPFTGKFRVLGLTTSSMVLACVGTAEATISFRVAGMFASSPFKLRVIDVYTIFVGVRRVAVFALFFGIGRVRLGAFAWFNIDAFAAFNAGGVGAIFDTGWAAALTFFTAKWDAPRQRGVL